MFQINSPSHLFECDWLTYLFGQATVEFSPTFAGTKLPNLAILLPLEKTEIQTPKGKKTINLAGRYVCYCIFLDTWKIICTCNMIVLLKLIHSENQSANTLSAKLVLRSFVMLWLCTSFDHISYSVYYINFNL